MDNLAWSSGVDRGETMPPVPARRTKRKMTTTEDSSTLNTGVSEQTVCIMPPPRRKHKPQPSQPNSNSSASPEQRDNVFPKQVEEDNRVTASRNRATLTACAENDLVDKSRLPAEELTDHKVCSELKNLNFESNLEILVDVDDTDNSLERTEKSADLTLRRSCVESNIFEMFIDNRVLELPLVAGSRESIGEQVDLLKEDCEIKTSNAENSAMIVGVFYKPEYSSLSKSNDNKSDLQILSLNVESRLWQNSTDHCSEKATVGVLEEESKKVENKALVKESEENDSGVYFSDTKSPPFKESYFDQDDVASKEENSVANHPPYPSSQYPYTCDDRDTHDNKTMEDPGCKSYRNMLDDFEGQTVKALREEVTSLFSVCNGEVSKTKVVEDWLDSGKYSLEKKNNTNRNFTEYLKTMLNTESQRDSLSPYPLSTVDEDDRSDVVSEDLQEPRWKDGVVRNVLPRATFTHPVSSLDHTESSDSSSNNNRPIGVTVNNVNVYYVNTDCKEIVSSETEPVDSIVKNELKDLKNEQDAHVVDNFTSKVTNNVVTSVENIFVRNRNLDLIVNKSPTPASAIKQGVVTSLIAYFEQIKHQEFEPSYSDESFSARDDDTANDPEEDSESNGTPTIDIDDSFETNEQVTKGEIVKCSYEPDVFAKDMFCSSIVPQSDCLKDKCFDSLAATTNEVLEEDEGQNALFQEKSETENHQSFENCEFELTEKETLNETTNDVNTIISNDFCGVQSFTNNENNFEDNQDHHSENLVSTFIEDELCSNVPSDDDATKLVDRSTVDLKNPDYLTKVEDIVPTSSNVTKEEIVDINEDSLPAFKPTMIPVVVLTEADLETNQIGSIELHASLESAYDNAESPPEISESTTTENVNPHVNRIFFDDEKSFAKPESDSDVIEVVLEKNWGSFGLKLEEDEDGVTVSDIMAGGSADDSGQIFKGWINLKKMAAGQEEIFC